jgi:acylphosphatase
MQRSTGEGIRRERAVAGIVRGRVQGVGFRWFVVETARRHGIAGHVRNLPDGAVEFHAQGPAGPVEALLRAVARGPASARVEAVETRDVEVREGQTGFEVRY